MVRASNVPAWIPPFCTGVWTGGVPAAKQTQRQAGEGQHEGLLLTACPSSQPVPQVWPQPFSALQPVSFPCLEPCKSTGSRFLAMDHAGRSDGDAHFVPAQGCDPPPEPQGARVLVTQAALPWMPGGCAGHGDTARLLGGSVPGWAGPRPQRYSLVLPATVTFSFRQPSPWW